MAVTNAERPETNFRRVPAGWVFRAPALWIFGRAPHYLVNDEQKDRITATLKPRHPKLATAIGVTAIIAWAVAMPLKLWALSDHPDPTPRDIVLMVILIVVPLALAACAFSAIQRRRLAPILAGARLTSERITYADMRSAMERATPPRQARVLWIASTVASVAMAAFVLANVMTKHTLLAPMPLLFTFLAAINAWQAVRCYRISRRRPSEN